VWLLALAQVGADAADKLQPVVGMSDELRGENRN
jgi:hypothetical protein